MKCPLCGLEFAESKAACKGCVMARSCHMVKCPNCGYETPGESNPFKALASWRKRLNGIRRKS